MVVLFVLCLGAEFFLPLARFVRLQSFRYIWVAEWPPIGKMATHSAYNMFS